jgi:anti-anti-sigma regulatory factor
MATIEIVRSGSLYRLVIKGALAARDLKRLEHACRDALQHKSVPLEIDVSDVTSMDDSARTYLGRLLARGASLLGAGLSDGIVDGR